MAQYVFSNNVQTTLAGAISSTATTITLTATVNFPTIPTGYVWAVTLNDAATQKVFEIVYVSSISGANLEGCLRGQEGTTAQAWLANDKAFAADTAGILGSFVSSAQAGGFVKLNPAVTQTGGIGISGNFLFGGSGTISGTLFVAQIEGNIAEFSAGLTAQYFIASAPYTSIPPYAWSSNPSYGNGTTYIGSDSGVSAAGIKGDQFIISVGGIGYALTVDHFLNLGVGASIVAEGSITSLTGSVIAPTITQNGSQVVSTLSSSTLSLSKSGSNYDIELPSQLMVGGRFANLSNGGQPTITLPNYGLWFIEVFYGVQEVTNTNMTITLSVIGGTITNSWLTNANGHTAFNAESIIFIYGRGYTTINNQTLTFSLTATGGAFDSSNQPWTVWATRYA